MADNFTFPGGVNTYVPTLSTDLMVTYVRNPDKFPINRYINVRKVDKMKGFYVKWKNDGQARIINVDDNAWQDGNDAPMNTQGGDTFDFPQYNCVRRAYVDQVGHLAVEQGSWDVLAKKAAEQVMKGMTARSYRVAQTIAATAQYVTGNVINASTYGATWANATSAAPSIRKSIMNLANLIQRATLGVVSLNELYLVINPNQAVVLSTSQEWIDFIKQSPAALDVWLGDAQFNTYNVPSKLFGLNVVIDDTVYTSNLPGPNTAKVTAYTIPDNTAIMVSRQQDIAPSFGPAFSTFTLFAYEDFSTYVYNDVKNRRYDLQVTEITDDSFVFAPDAGGIIQTNS